MDVQLPEQYEKNVHRPSKIYALLGFYDFLCDLSKAEIDFSSG